MKFRFPKIFYSRWFLVILMILLISGFTVELRQWRTREAINKEISHLELERQALEQKNRDLEQSLQYFGSDAYKEKLAREQLGLRREGEVVINFPKLAQNETDPQNHIEPSNPEKWWHYIFLNNN